MNTEQLRAEFEAWYAEKYPTEPPPERHGEGYFHLWDKRLFSAYQAGRAALQSQHQDDAERYRWLLGKFQQSYDGEDFESDAISIYSRMASQFKGERTIQADIAWRDKTDEPIGLSEAIDHARQRDD